MFSNLKAKFPAACISAAIVIGLSACGGGGSNAPMYTPASTGASANTAAAPAADNNLVNTSRGKELFQQRCMACHGEAGNARNENAANLQMSRLDSPQIVQTIQNGRGVMPGFKDAIADTDIGQLEVYVKSLRR